MTRVIPTGFGVWLRSVLFDGFHEVCDVQPQVAGFPAW